MKCPCCQKALKVPESVYLNVEMYQRPVITTTQCCGRAIIVSSEIKFNIFPYNGNRKHDDWGNIINKKLR